MFLVCKSFLCVNYLRPSHGVICGFVFECTVTNFREIVKYKSKWDNLKCTEIPGVETRLGPKIILKI